MMPSRILVVDDNPVNLRLLCDLLTYEGYEIQSAIDADTALIQIQTAKPDLILLDIGLPGMDGLTLARKLKSEDGTRDIRIVALTAYAMKGDRDKAIDAGCDGYISKPIDTRMLTKQIMELLN